jgi:cell division protein FtsI/penicillin-binding protein 2
MKLLKNDNAIPSKKYRVQLSVIDNNMHYGFDKLWFPENTFKVILSMAGLNKKYSRNSDNCDSYMWSNDNISIETRLNPLTGDGYAHYLGISGETNLVSRIVDYILKNAEYDDHSNGRDFI